MPNIMLPEHVPQNHTNNHHYHKPSDFLDSLHLCPVTISATKEHWPAVNCHCLKELSLHNWDALIRS